MKLYKNMTTMTKEKVAQHQARHMADVNVRSIDTERRTVTVVASTEAVDSYNSIIRQGGWDFSRFAKNPVIQLAHDWEALPIGRAVRYEVVNNQLEIDIQFAPEDASPTAERVWQLWKLGFIRAVSVGFQPIEYHWEEREGGSILVFDRAELIEVSVVAIPSNPETLSKSISRSLRSKDKDKREAGESMIALMARMASQPHDDDGEEEEEIEEEGTENLEAEENRAILKAYRKLVPALRAIYGVETFEDEAKQVQSIKDAIQSRDSEPEPESKAETVDEPIVEEPEKAPASDEPEATPAEEPEAKPADDTAPIDDELEIDENDIEAIVDATAQKLNSAN